MIEIGVKSLSTVSGVGWIRYWILKSSLQPPSGNSHRHENLNRKPPSEKSAVGRRVIFNDGIAGGSRDVRFDEYMGRDECGGWV